MNAAFQPVQNMRQRLAFDNAKPHGIRQYEHTQALISPVEAAGMACCDVTDEPSGMSWPVVIGSCIAGLGMWAIYAALSVVAIDHFGMAGLIGSILGACAIVGAVAKLGRFV